MPEVFLDEQSLGLRPFLEMAGVSVRDQSNIPINKKARTNIPHQKILEFVKANQGLILVTKDKVLRKDAKAKNVNVIFIDESEVAATEVLRQLASGKF